MGRHSATTQRRRRWSAPAAALAVPAAALLSAGADALPRAEVVDSPACCAELIAAGPTDAAAANYQFQPSTPQAMLASRALRRSPDAALPAGVAPESGLQVKTILAARAVSAMFPEIQNIGGVRPDALRWHPDGLAIDVMIPNYSSDEGIQLGNLIASYALQNADRFGLDDVIWRQTYYPAHGTPHPMADRGSDTANHYNHVHIATVGGGYPHGHEVYIS
ncbi:hypothetical protein [Mycolicibacterium chubuense]|uniref:hypothetical protein n=1 Tax=Mycolicibacterium chubuense TaxID=1800 RepID=UPI00030D1E87|nr:hypothetical protein [Mycolicibacterium chubuense]